jgi:hypothetical protein
MLPHLLERAVYLSATFDRLIPVICEKAVRLFEVENITRTNLGFQQVGEFSRVKRVLCAALA